MRIAFFDAKSYDKPAFDKFSAEKGMNIKYFEAKLNEDTVELAHGFDAVCVFVNDTVNAAVIDRLTELGVKAVALRCAGFNNVDMKHAYGRIHVLRVPAYSPYAVAEHTMALLLTSIRRIHKAYIRTRDFNFSLAGMTGFDLHGKTVGVIGTGRIGRAFIDICLGFGMRVLAYDKFEAPNLADGERIRYVTKDELFEMSDIISLHCPLTDETYHIINKDSLGKCKKGVVILNTSRGALVDAEDLLEKIKTRLRLPRRLRGGIRLLLRGQIGTHSRRRYSGKTHLDAKRYSYLASGVSYEGGSSQHCRYHGKKSHLIL